METAASAPHNVATPNDPELLVCGKLQVDPRIKKVTVSGEHIRLSDKEYQFLEFLLRNKGTLLSNQACLDELYPDRPKPEPDILRVMKCNMLKKMRAVADVHQYFQTVHGRGRMIVDPDQA